MSCVRNLRRTRSSQIRRHDDRAGGTRRLELHRRSHARWYICAGNSPEAKAWKESFRSGGQQVNGRCSSLTGKVQSGSDDLISEHLGRLPLRASCTATDRSSAPSA
jgi:hypothetical protein